MTADKYEKEEERTANTDFASGGLTWKLEALCSETRPNAKPESVSKAVEQ